MKIRLGALLARTRLRTFDAVWCTVAQDVKVSDVEVLFDHLATISGDTHLVFLELSVEDRRICR